MAQLLYVLLALIVTSALTGAGVLYLQGDLLPRLVVQADAETAFFAYKADWSMDVAMRGVVPAAQPGGALPSAFSSAVPGIPGTDWSYGIRSGVGAWICLSGTQAEPAYAAYARLQAKLGATQLVVSDACGQTAGDALPVPWPPATWPATVAVTLWLPQG